MIHAITCILFGAVVAVAAVIVSWYLFGLCIISAVLIRERWFVD